MTAVIWCCVFNLFLSRVMSGICIQRDIIGNVFYSTFTNVFYFRYVFTFFNVFLFFFERFYIYVDSSNEQLDYRRGTALQDGSVLAKSGRRYFADSRGLSSTTVTQQACKAIKFGEIKQNKGYAVQGHSRSPMSVPIERTCATSYQ